jgi:hypothetical protein
VRLVLGTHSYQGDPDAIRRQSSAADALKSLADVIAVDVQWRATPPLRPWITTVAALGRDATTVTRCAGRTKPIVSDILDALALVAEREGCRSFFYMNSDITVSQRAVALVSAGDYEAYAFSRMDCDGAGHDIGMVLTGCDAFAFDVAWWRANRRRFRTYILGEPCWDNVYTSVLMCHAKGILVNREALISHEVHATRWGASAFAEYNGYLATLDARYFTLWATYHARLVEGRARGASEEQERSLAANVFVWRRSPVLALRQAARDMKARIQHRRRRSRWPPVK